MKIGFTKDILRNLCEMKLQELFESLEHWDKDGNGFLIGYRVVNTDGEGNIVSQANSRVKLPARVGAVHNVPMFVSNSPEYVKTYYWHGNEDPDDPPQVLMSYSFMMDDILSGSPHDREPELSISKGQVLNIEPLT